MFFSVLSVSLSQTHTNTHTTTINDASTEHNADQAERGKIIQTHTYPDPLDHKADVADALEVCGLID